MEKERAKMGQWNREREKDRESKSGTEKEKQEKSDRERENEIVEVGQRGNVGGGGERESV